jgi:hypothetical protein
MMLPGGAGVSAGFNSDNRQTIVVNGNVNFFGGSRDSGRSLSVSGGIQARLTSQLMINLDPRLNVQTDRSQYVTSTATMAYAETYGRRYFFGDLEQKTLSLEARVEYTLSPTLSFQLFAQPLLSSGDYVAYKQLRAPGTYDFRVFHPGQATSAGGRVLCAGGSICRDAAGTQHVDLNGDVLADFSFGDRDFNVRSLIGNAVLRWEYRPGSTVFVVWQRQQQHDGTLGDFDFGRDMNALWGAPADNRFIVKANYWLGL